MGKIISIANQKGGVGKTTTTVNLAAWIGAKGKKVLLADIDPQGNATSGFGINKRSLMRSSYDLLIGTAEAEDIILSTSFQNVDVLPSNIALAGAEIEIVEMEAAQLPRSLDSLDLAVINGNYAIQAGLNVADALAIEAADGTAGTAYVNVLAVAEGREEDPAIQALVAALESDAVKTFMEETYGGAVVPVF